MMDYMLFLLLLLSIAATSTTGSTTVGPVIETTKTADSTTEAGAAGSTATTVVTTGSTATTAGTEGSTATTAVTTGSTATTAGTEGSTATTTSIAGSTATGTAGSTTTGTAGSPTPGGLSCFSCTGQAKDGACDTEQESKASKTQCAADEFCEISSTESNGNYTVVRGCTKTCGSTYYERHCETTKETECKKCCKTNNCNAESFSSGNRLVGSCVALLIGTLLVVLAAF